MSRRAWLPIAAIAAVLLLACWFSGFRYHAPADAPTTSTIELPTYTAVRR